MRNVNIYLIYAYHIYNYTISISNDQYIKWNAIIAYFLRSNNFQIKLRIPCVVTIFKENIMCE